MEGDRVNDEIKNVEAQSNDYAQKSSQCESFLTKYTLTFQTISLQQLAHSF